MLAIESRFRRLGDDINKKRKESRKGDGTERVGRQKQKEKAGSVWEILGNSKDNEGD